jgi:hypothetical protein
MKKKTITARMLHDAIQRWPAMAGELNLGRERIIRNRITNIIKSFERTHHGTSRGEPGLPNFELVLDTSAPKISHSLLSSLSHHYEGTTSDEPFLTRGLDRTGNATQEWRTFRELMTNEIATLYANLWRERIKTLKREPYQPIKDRLEEVIAVARHEAGRTLPWRPHFHLKRFEEDRLMTTSEGTKSFAIGAGWKLMTEKLQSPRVSDRFILSAKQVDDIGVIDLYQISYLEGQSPTIQYGYLGKYKHDSIRGFGIKPDTALQWTKRQIIMAANKKLGLGK